MSDDEITISSSGVYKNGSYMGDVFTTGEIERIVESESRPLREKLESMGEKLESMSKELEKRKRLEELRNAIDTAVAYRSSVPDRNAAINEYITLKWRGMAKQATRVQERMATNEKRVRYADGLFKSMITEAHEMSNEDLYEQLERMHNAGQHLLPEDITEYGIRRDLSVVETDGKTMDELVRKREIVVRTSDLTDPRLGYSGIDGLKRTAKNILWDEEYAKAGFWKKLSMSMNKPTE